MITFENNLFHLTGKNISYVIEVSKEGYLIQRYFGKKLHRAAFQPFAPKNHGFSVVMEDGVCLDGVPQEYPSYGQSDLRTPAYVVRNLDGNTICCPLYRTYKIMDGKPALQGLPAVYDHQDTAKTLEITMEDDIAGVRVVLSYTVFEEFDVVCRNARIENMTDGELTLLAAASASVDLPVSGYDVVYFAGAWARERHVRKIPSAQGKIEISNARGGSGHQINPFIMAAEPGTNETHGEVYGFSLVYSGNHASVVEVDQHQSTRILSGINPQGFEAELGVFQTPECILAYSSEGYGALSRTYQDLYRNNLCRGNWKYKERPILINNWEATYFDFNEEKLLNIVDLAKEVGIELFVLDDGWFGKRDNDRCSLGDWKVNLQKLPSGIKGLAEKVNQKGMAFGLWFEPEMISPDSELFRAHPDWAIQVPGRKPVLGRHQLILDLSKPEVCDYIIDSVGQILEEASISYVKWDMNRHMTDMPRDGYNHQYILGLYRILETLTTRFPEILFESCSGGGGRFDAGLLYYMPQVWTSDDTDAVERLYIQYGTSMGYPVSTMGAHVTAVPNHQTGRCTPLKTRADVAYTGVFGYELDITKLPQEEIEEIKEQVKTCKQLRPLVMKGDFYRLYNPFEGNVCGWQLVSKEQDQSYACFTRILAVPNSARFLAKFDGLDPAALYEDQDGNQYGGDELMYKGVLIPFPEGDYRTVTYLLKKVK